MSSRISRRIWIKKATEIDELAGTKLKLSTIVEDTEHHIAELQEQLQQELQHAKQEARGAAEARDAHAEEMADLAEWNANSTSITLSP
jgi:formate-dependent nitrite reductase cytochrome c552 subunit